MHSSTLPGTGPWSWLEPGLWVYRSRELDLLGQADGLLADAAPEAREGGSALVAVKRRLHEAGIGAATAPAAAGGGGHRFVVQVAIQFLAGYHDLNLRDAASVGHGAILCADPDWRGRREVVDVIRGALVGLASTESAGPGGTEGGPDQGAGTRAVRSADGWTLTGVKHRVSRVVESDAFVVFARSPEHVSAFYVPAGTPGVTPVPADPERPGWSWGELRLDGATVPQTAVLGTSVGGVAVFRRHFAEYRPLVAASCLGAAAACVDAWVSDALSRADDGRTVPTDVAERLGDLRGRLLLAFGGLLTGAAHPGGIDGSWSKMVRAQAVRTALDVAVAAADGLVGTDGEAKVLVDRVLRDLEAFEHGDGGGEPLLRSAGERFVRYSAAIMDEISEPTSTVPRPRFG